MKLRMMLSAMLSAGIVLAVPQTAVRAADDNASDEKRMVCETGPLVRAFGGHDWVVYACNDDASMIIMAPPETEAGRSFLFLGAGADGYDIAAEADGDRAITQAARDEIASMSTRELAGLLAEVRLAAE